MATKSATLGSSSGEVADHATTHISTGTDAIPTAIPGGASGLLSGTWAALLDAATNAATALTLVLRDAAGRFKAANPSADDDVDTMGARNAALGYLPPTRVAYAGTPIREVDNVTTGISFVMGRDCSCIGAEFYWVSLGASESIKITLRSSAGTVLATSTIAVTTTGIHTVTWASPIALTRGTLYRIGSFATGIYVDCTETVLRAAMPFSWTRYNAGQGVFVLEHVYGTGDANPATPQTNEVYLVAPITK